MWSVWKDGALLGGLERNVNKDGGPDGMGLRVKKRSV